MSILNQGNDKGANLKYERSSNKQIGSSIAPILVVRAKWSWGGESKILKLNPFDPVRDAMYAAGFSLESTLDHSDE